MYSEVEQDEISSDIVIRLKNQMRFTSLKVLCVRKVAESLPQYAYAYAKNRGQKFKLSSVLSEPLCCLVYNECLQSKNQGKHNLTWHNKNWIDCDFEDQAICFAGLQQFDCKILSLEAGLLPDSHRTQPFDQFARESAPKLKVFRDSFFYNYLHLKKRVQLASHFYSLHSMTGLVELEIKYYPVKDADLQVIGLQLPLLQRLTLFAQTTRMVQRRLFYVAVQESLSLQGLEYLRNLTSLKHLTLLFDDCDWLQSGQLVKGCLQLMPQVNTVGKSSSFFKDFVPHEFPPFKDPVELGLEHLVWGRQTVIPSNVTLPNVTRITVCLHAQPIFLQQFKKLHKLAYLGSYAVGWPHVQQTSSQVGHSLKILALSSTRLIDLKQVLQSSPNLEKLKLHGMLLEGNFQAPQWSNCVKNLKKFNQYCSPTTERVEKCYNCPGLLQLLLTSCPELEKLSLDAIRLTKAELDLINGEMEAGALAIQKLQDVNIKAVFDEDALVSFAEFATKFCVKNCNILRFVRITKCYIWGNVAPELNLALKLQGCINEKYKL